MMELPPGTHHLGGREGVVVVDAVAALVFGGMME